ncbi:MAG: hypothetical protein AABW67_05860 [Nanoarchaeota archaeon]
MEHREFIEKISDYKSYRKIQKSLEKYWLSPTQFDVLIDLYPYSETWVSYEEVRKSSDIESYASFIERGIKPSLLKGYLETRKRDANRKDIRITSKGKGLVEIILEEN